MKHKTLGNTGLDVSALALGTMTFGDGADDAACFELYTLARDAGVTVFDCANVYANGLAEIILGKLTKDHRKDVILASKAYYPMQSAPDEQGLGSTAVTKALESSLMRLGTDYLDIFYLHAFDPLVPLEETIGALDGILKAGKARHVGLSNFAAWQVMKAKHIASRIGDFELQIIQPMYNLMKRQAETELLPMAASENMGVFTYSPLAGGLLTGKYQIDSEEPGRFDESVMYQKRYSESDTVSKVDRFIKLAATYAIDPVALAIAWCAYHPAVTAPLIGARSTSQLGRALAAADTRLDPELLLELDQVFAPPPPATDRLEEQMDAKTG